MKPLIAKHRRTLLVPAGGVLFLAMGLLLLRGPSGRPEAAGVPPRALPNLRMVNSDEGLAALSPHVRELLDRTAEPSRHRTVELIRDLPGDLGKTDKEALLAALQRPRGPNESEGFHSVFFHELALAMGQDDSILEPLARVLATVAREDSRDLVIRDYALQHLRQVWELSDGELRDGIEASFAEISSSRSELSSSALLSLHLLGTGLGESGLSVAEATARSGWSVPDERISSALTEILSREPTEGDIAERMTAVRIVGDRRLESHRDSLKGIITDSGPEHQLVRMSAIAALARLGDPEDAAYLDALDQSDPRIAAAVSHAVAQLQTSK